MNMMSTSCQSPIAPDNPVNHDIVLGHIIPIADMRGVDSLNYSKAEKVLRCKLASGYRLLDLFSWSDGVNSYISVRLGLNTDEFLFSPNGILHDEMTASSFVRINTNGQIIDAGSTGFGLNQNEVSLHLAIYRSRPDVRCVMHFASPSALAISAMKCGLLPLCYESMVLGEIKYSEYTSAIFSDEDEQKLSLADDQTSKIMFMRNFGVFIGESCLEEGFNTASHLMTAIQTQLNILPFGLENLHIPSVEVQKEVQSERENQTIHGSNSCKVETSEAILQFDGMMRMLDSAGYHTGYPYKRPLFSGNKFQSRSHSLMDMMIAPTKLSLNEGGFRGLEESEKEEKDGGKRTNLKMSMSMLENRSTSVDISSHKFIPMGTDIHEFKRKVKQIRKYGVTSSGPRSNVLEGASWQDARRIQESRTGEDGEGVVVKVTAASRAVIQREHQQSAVICKDYSTVNPFGRDTKKELNDYLEEMQKKTVEKSTFPVNDEFVEKNESKKAEETVRVELNERKLISSGEIQEWMTSNAAERFNLDENKTRCDEAPPQSSQNENLEKSKLIGNEERQNSTRQEDFSTRNQSTVEEKTTSLNQSTLEKSETVMVDEGLNQSTSKQRSPKEEKVPGVTEQALSSSSSSPSSSKPVKLRQSQSVKDDERIREASSPVDVLLSESSNEKEKKKKKRGLSAIFSKKK